MFTGIVLLAIVPIVLLVVAYFISRAVFRIVMGVMSILFIILIVTGGYVIYDAYRFSGSLDTEPNRFMLENQSAGVEAFNESITELDEDALALETNATVFTVTEAFIAPEALARFDSINVSRNRTLQAIRSDDPHASFAHALTDDPLMRELYEDALREEYDETQMRSQLFGQLLSSTLEIRGSDALILGIREGTIEVEPDRVVLRFIRAMPAQVIEQTLNIEVD